MSVKWIRSLVIFTLGAALYVAPSLAPESLPVPGAGQWSR